MKTGNVILLVVAAVIFGFLAAMIFNRFNRMKRKNGTLAYIPISTSTSTNGSSTSTVTNTSTATNTGMGEPESRLQSSGCVTPNYSQGQAYCNPGRNLRRVQVGGTYQLMCC